MSNEKIQRMDRTTLIYDPDGLDIKVGVEDIKNPDTNQWGLWVSANTMKYRKTGDVVQEPLVSQICQEIEQDCLAEGEYVRFAR